MLLIFLYLLICEVITIKAIFVFASSTFKPKHVLFATGPFFRKMLVSYFSTIIPLYIKNNPAEKWWKVLEMEFKTCTPVNPKCVFEKVKLKVLLYSQYDFIRQIPVFRKDQVSIFKNLVINYFILIPHSILFATNVLLKLSYL